MRKPKDLRFKDSDGDLLEIDYVSEKGFLITCRSCASTRAVLIGEPKQARRIAAKLKEIADWLEVQK